MLLHRTIAGLAAVIDRPQGTEKTFRTPRGPEVCVYPVDYGYLADLINLDDGEDLDVFFGTGGPHYGRFMKGSNYTGTWQPDERKWYHALTDAELAAVLAFYTDQDPDLLQDHVRFEDEAAWRNDILFCNQPPTQETNHAPTRTS